MVFWWIGFLRLILPRYDFTVGQLMVTLLWALFPAMGVGLGWLWGIETAVRKKVALARL